MTRLAVSVAIATVCVVPVGMAGAQTPAIDVFASPNGSGAVCSEPDPCSLVGARDKVRQAIAGGMTSDVEVLLADGTYRLSSTLDLDPDQDSGRDGHRVIYRAAAGANPVISGAVQVTGWQTDPTNPSLWTASVPAGTTSRQLFVDGVRAQRAQTGTTPETRPGGVLGPFTKVSDGGGEAIGYTVSQPKGDAIRTWPNPRNIEFVWTRVPPYTEPRCDVDSVTVDPSDSTKTLITLRQPCFGLVDQTRALQGTNLGGPSTIENALPLLDQPGEWYLDQPTGQIHYYPRAGESMTDSDFELPVLQQLIAGSGTPANPIHDLAFDGITFSDATWLGPSSDTGFSEAQENLFKTTLPDPAVFARGNVAFRAAHRVEFANDRFTHLGGQGLSFDTGSQDNLVSRSTFDDISSAAIRLGQVNDDSASTPLERRDVQNTIADNSISRAGAEYLGAPGIATGKVANTTITHNDIGDLPWSGIDMGFGGGSNTYGAGNEISGNSVHDVMKRMSDGGGIYVNGYQPGSRIFGNWIHDDRAAGDSSSAIYVDNSSDGWEVDHNVASATNGSRWLNVQSRVGVLARNTTVHDNFADTTVMLPCNDPAGPCCGPDNLCTYPGDPSNVFSNNTFVLDGIWPAPAQAIMRDAGIRPLATPPGSSPPPNMGPGGATGARAMALERCKHKHGKKKRKACRKKAQRLPL